MRSVVVLTLCVVAVMASADDKIYDVAEAPQLFTQFMKDYSKTYKDDADKNVHYAAFVENLKKINRLNVENPSATFGINKFADYTDEETKSMRGLKSKKN